MMDRVFDCTRPSGKVVKWGLSLALVTALFGWFGIPIVSPVIFAVPAVLAWGIGRWLTDNRLYALAIGIVLYGFIFALLDGSTSLVLDLVEFAPFVVAAAFVFEGVSSALDALGARISDEEDEGEFADAREAYLAGEIGEEELERRVEERVMDDRPRAERERELVAEKAGDGGERA